MRDQAIVQQLLPLWDQSYDYTESLMQSLIQILKVNEPKAWSMEGRSGFAHSAECVLITEEGEVEAVGVLRIRGEEMIKKAQVGTYRGTFALRADPASRRIEAVLTDLQPVKKAGAGFVPVDGRSTAPVAATPKV